MRGESFLSGRTKGAAAGVELSCEVVVFIKIPRAVAAGRKNALRGEDRMRGNGMGFGAVRERADKLLRGWEIELAEIFCRSCDGVRGARKEVTLDEI